MHALLLSLILTVTPTPPIDYCQGFHKCTWNNKELFIDISDSIWLGFEQRESVYSRALEYCQTHPGAKVTIVLASGKAEGACGE